MIEASYKASYTIALDSNKYANKIDDNLNAVQHHVQSAEPSPSLQRHHTSRIAYLNILRQKDVRNQNGPVTVLFQTWKLIDPIGEHLAHRLGRAKH